MLLDDHEACREEMKRIDAEWRDRYDLRTTIKRIIKEDKEGNLEVMMIHKIIWNDDGMTVWVR